MPPTALNRQVAQLEDALQARLLQRSARKLTLTDAGRTLFDQSVGQITALKNAANQLPGENETPKGNIRVAIEWPKRPHAGGGQWSLQR